MILKKRSIQKSRWLTTPNTLGVHGQRPRLIAFDILLMQMRKLSLMLSSIQSDDPAHQMVGVEALRKLLSSVDPPPPIDEVLASPNALERLIELMALPHSEAIRVSTGHMHHIHLCRSCSSRPQNVVPSPIRVPVRTTKSRNPENQKILTLLGCRFTLTTTIIKVG
jgi:hypothetical protein